MKKKIEVLMRENVDNLGTVGEKITVAVGYARNYLLPNNLVLVKSHPDYKKILEQIKERRIKLQKEIDQLKEKAEKIKGQTVIFKVKTTEKGKMFGSISAEDIAKEMGIEKKYIATLPLKTLGEHKVEIKLDSGIVSQIVVKLLKEEEK